MSKPKSASRPGLTFPQLIGQAVFDCATLCGPFRLRRLQRPAKLPVSVTVRQSTLQFPAKALPIAGLAAHTRRRSYQISTTASDRALPDRKSRLWIMFRRRKSSRRACLVICRRPDVKPSASPPTPMILTRAHPTWQPAPCGCSLALCLTGGTDHAPG